MEILHTIDIMLSLLIGSGQGAGLWSSLFCEFESSLGQEFELIWEFSLFQKFREICESHNFQVPRSPLRDWMQISHWVVRKNVVCIVFLHIHDYHNYYHY